MSLRLFNIPPDIAFLPALTRAILDHGFPGTAPPALADLPRWTILLPTRRAVRSLQRSFLTVAGRDAMLLPRHPSRERHKKALPFNAKRERAPACGDGYSRRSWDLRWFIPEASTGYPRRGRRR